MISGESSAKHQRLFISEAVAKTHKNKILYKKKDFIYHLKQVSTTHVTACFPSVTLFFCSEFCRCHIKTHGEIQD